MEILEKLHKTVLSRSLPGFRLNEFLGKRKMVEKKKGNSELEFLVGGLEISSELS
jgi:hypothetical protein